MGTLYIDTGGSATNSGSSDNNAADLSGSAATVAAAVVSLDGSPDLSGVSTSGENQAAIYLNDATNSNQKIFWITTVDNVLKTVTVSVAPTGVTSSAWAIGGRFVWTPASIESALRAGDLVTINNSPASSAADIITPRTSGDSTSGRIKVVGKSGSRPVITQTGTAQCIDHGQSQNLWHFENLECIQQGASGAAIADANSAKLLTYYNVKVSDAGGIALQSNGVGGVSVIACEITGAGANGLDSNQNSQMWIGNYVHDLTGIGIRSGNTSVVNVCLNNIIDTCTGKGINFAGAVATAGINGQLICGNTVYGCGDSGLEITDIDVVTVVTNNIFSENGNAAGEFNVEFVAAAAELISFHGWNVFYHSGGGGGANLSNLTVNAQVASSEFTTDPGFTDAAGGNFAISSTSPAKATGFPGQFLGGSLGYLDIGAVQRQEAGGSGGGLRLAGHGGLAA